MMLERKKRIHFLFHTSFFVYVFFKYLASSSCLWIVSLLIPFGYGICEKSILFHLIYDFSLCVTIFTKTCMKSLVWFDIAAPGSYHLKLKCDNQLSTQLSHIQAFLFSSLLFPFFSLSPFRIFLRSVIFIFFFVYFTQPATPSLSCLFSWIELHTSLQYVCVCKS